MNDNCYFKHLEGLTVMYLLMNELKPSKYNPRIHTKKQIHQIADSIRVFNFVNPILIDEEKNIIAGHGRLLAAKELGMRRVPTICLEHMTDSQKRAYLIADNKLTEIAGWDDELVANTLDYITKIDADLDIAITGLETAEIDLLFERYLSGPTPPDIIPDIDPSIPPVSQPGDLWLLGQHRILCADATEKDAFTLLMDKEKAGLVFIDPPYNVPIDGHVCGSGKIKHREFKMAAGEMTEAEFTTFLKTVFTHLVNNSNNGSIHYVCMDWRHICEVMAAGRKVYTELKNLCVWNKNNAGMGSLYRSKHELVFVFKSGTHEHINNVVLGKFGRYRTNVWDYDGVNTLEPARRKELSLHPTVKPIAMVADAIEDCSKRKQIVLDCFAGSGTTLLAAEKTGRRSYGMELDPHYVDLTITRFAQTYEIEAIHAETGLDFYSLKYKRKNNPKHRSRKTGRQSNKGKPHVKR